jgi:hypothetical protein
MLTKSGTDCTTWFPEIAEALAMLPGGPQVIDGEVCVLRADGTIDFNLLQARARRRKPYPGGPQVLRTPRCSRQWSGAGLAIEGVMAKSRSNCYRGCLLCGCCS